MSSYIYRKKPNPVVDHNLYELTSNPTTFGYNTPVGGQLGWTPSSIPIIQNLTDYFPSQLKILHQQRITLFQ